MLVRSCQAPRSTLPDHVPVTWFAAGGRRWSRPRAREPPDSAPARCCASPSRDRSRDLRRAPAHPQSSTPGRSRQLDAHTLAFAPHGDGFGVDAEVGRASARGPARRTSEGDEDADVERRSRLTAGYSSCSRPRLPAGPVGPVGRARRDHDLVRPVMPCFAAV